MAGNSQATQYRRLKRAKKDAEELRRPYLEAVTTNIRNWESAIAATDKAWERNNNFKSNTEITDNSSSKNTAMEFMTNSFVETIEDNNLFNCETDQRLKEIDLMNEKNDDVASEVENHLIKLHAIFTSHNITQNAQRELLKFMKEGFCDSKLANKLPKDPRSLRPETIPYSLRDTHPGRSMYIKLSHILNYSNVKLYNSSANTIQLSVNIDGLPIFRGSNGIGFWPILGSIGQNAVFILGLYEGRSKPRCSNDFLQEFVNDMIDMKGNGIIIKGKHFKFELEKILMDAPAASYIVGVKSHNSRFPCRKCTVEGKKVNLNGQTKTGKLKTGLRYLDVNCNARSASDFIHHFDNTVDEHSLQGYNDDGEKLLLDENDDDNIGYFVNEAVSSHHNHPTNLIKIPNFNPVDDVPLDYMHLICLGIIKRLISFWMTPGLCKLQNNQIEAISDALIRSREHVPIEFQRKPDELKYYTTWKATQFRFFGLYIGAIVLTNNMRKDMLENFYLFVYCLRILAMNIEKNDMYKETLKYRSDDIKIKSRYFVQDCIQIYTPIIATYNLHNFIHAADDYSKFGAIDDYSCFRYESFLGKIKNMVKGPCNPLLQVIHKYSSILHIGTQYQSIKDISYEEYYFEIPLLKKKKTTLLLKNEEFLELQFKKFILRTDRIADQFCQVVDNGKKVYLKINHIFKCRDGEIFISGQKFTKSRPLFTLPKYNISSENIGMVIVSSYSNENITYPIESIICKCFCLPSIVSSGEYFIVSFLH